MKPEMLQLTQRISVTKFLDPLDAAEVAQYIRHRLGVAGYQGKPLFTPDALHLVAQESGGIPRNINNICFGALSTAFALGRKKIDCEIVEEVAGEQNVKSLARRMSQSSARDAGEETSGTLEGRPLPARASIWRSLPAWLGRYGRTPPTSDCFPARASDCATPRGAEVPHFDQLVAVTRASLPRTPSTRKRI